MKRRIPYLLELVACAAVAVLLCGGKGYAATCEKWAGKVVSWQGTVEVKPAGESQWRAVKLYETFCPGDTIRTDRRSRADIALYNHPVLRLDQNTTVTLGGMKDERTSLVDMISGAALFFSRVTRNLDVRTATVNAGVEGTEFFVKADESKTLISIFEGKVLASNEAGSLAVTTGQSAVAEKGKAPTGVAVVRPRDAVRWALYYPPVLQARPEDLGEEGKAPRFHTARASQLLSVGRVDEAAADLDKALQLDPKNSDAFALRSIVSVTQNEKGQALDQARKAVESDPKSATARIALSYAQQSGFDLPGARASLEEAVKAEPGNALAWARLAEMRQSFGELDGSLEAAKKAASLSPDLSRTQTVLGFAYLTQVKTGEATMAFGKAIALDQADPLPRLGLGLAKIREGNLEEGRRDLEIAITLDPDSAILRSYLGKAYFEEKRDNLAASQYDMAKNLDPKDPTPHFYDAVRKQTENRPVEALQDLQKAIELNDNRAVYRSRLLLDTDLAARSASLARIYSDLGFQERALVEGWTSVNTDPSDFSGHRFLADSYSALPRREIARVSELLLSQLLQPINITPIQPRLAESNFFGSSGAGPSSLSFNEFNPLFNRNRVALQASGVVGNNSTAGEEVVLSGIYDRFSFSLGQNYFRTDGVRPKDDVQDQLFNAFVQYSISPKTSVQAEYRFRDDRRGDVQLIFWRDNFDPTLRQNDERDSFRLGFHHAFSPGSDLIGNFSYNKTDAGMLTTIFVDPASIDPAFVGFPDIQDAFKFSGDEKAYTGELQYLFRSDRVNAIAGAGYFKIDQDVTVNETASWPVTDPPTILFEGSDVTQADISHWNGYLYSYVKPFKRLALTIGASGDFYKNDDQNRADKDLKKNQFNPKFGVTWNVLPDTTIRGAVFRTLKRTLVTNQTLEPTQVAGFNQFYDDVNATASWIYGAAVDQKFSRSLFGGAEYYHRDLKLPTLVLDPSLATFSYQEARDHESVGRLYLNWTPHDWVGLRAGYGYEKYVGDRELSSGLRHVKTQSVPFGASIHHPSGVSLLLNPTYYRQEGEFQKKHDYSWDTGKDHFWVFDTAVSYRFPKRYGVLTLGASNLFDKKFDFLDLDFNNPRILPGRSLYSKVTVALP